MAHNALHSAAAECSRSSYCLRNLGHLVAVSAYVSGYVIAEICHTSTVSDIELKTLVEHLAGVYPHRASLAHDTYARHVDEDILCLLVIPLKASVESIVEKPEVKADVRLCRRLPLDVVIAELVTLEA